MNTLDDWLRQAGRLRFADAAVERRFHEERQAQGLTRARVMMALGMLVMCALGLVDVRIHARTMPEFAAASLQVRFLVVAPIWLLMLASTFLPKHAARADAVYAAGTTLIVWAVALLPWFFLQFFSGQRVAQLANVDVLAVLFISVAALPMRFGAIAAMVACGVAGVVALFLATQPLARADDVQIIATFQPGVGALLLVLSWQREAAERRMFAQREHMRALNEELARLNAEKDEFVAIAAHDLRAPLASVRGLAAQLRAGRLAEDAKRAQAHDAIHELSGRMLALVSDYLGAHALERGALTVKLARVDLRAAAEAARVRHAGLAEAKQQVIAIEAGSGEEIFARADEALLAQVADNFVTNALKFSPPGAAVRLAASATAAHVRLAVTDTGPGIAADEQAALFKKFGRASPRPTGGETSHGLGLAVAKRLAAAMGGRVGCESATGRGATFWIELARDA